VTAIDFSKIRSTPKSRNDSFEALAVQLFRSTFIAPSDATFISLRGDGGDGGVEAYYQFSDGTFIGVQAKYFFQLSDSELKQIDESLKTALTNHPNLKEYWIYIPFDLTGRVAAGKRGKSQAERYEEWKARVEATAKADGKTLNINLCTSSIIRDQLLAADPNGGLRKYWFDESVITDSKIRQGLSEAVAFAGPRYMAALDVVTNAHHGLDLFGGTGDFQAWKTETLTPIANGLRSVKRWGNGAFTFLGEPQSTKAEEILDQIVHGLDGITDSVTLLEVSSYLTELVEEIYPLVIKVREFHEKEFFEKHGEQSDTPAFRQFHAEYMCAFPASDMDASREWEAQISKVRNVMSSAEVGAATSRSLLLIGPAGIGKTHSIVSAALRRLEQGANSLVVFGDDFGKGEPWEVLRSKLGLGADISRETLLACLNTSAEHVGFPFLIFIDALNESPRDIRWKDKLPEFLTQCAPFPKIKVCVSTRDTYRDLVVDSRFPGYAFQHQGFHGEEFEAIQAFAKHYGLDAEITPLFSPDLSNPLFLHLACRTLKEQGKTTLDVSLPGFNALLDSHLKHCDKLVRDRLGYKNPKNIVRAAMIKLSEVLTVNLSRGETWEACSVAMGAILGKDVSAESFLDELRSEGLVILTSDADDMWYVRLGYQRYGDVLRALSIVESLQNDKGFDDKGLASKISKLAPEDHGFLEALASVLPEKTQIEITDPILGVDPVLAHQLFIKALVWRSRDSVTDDVTDHIYEALYTPGLWWDVYEVFFQLSLVPDHRLNAYNWLHQFFQSSSLVDRDAFLSTMAYKSYDAKGAVWSLIHAGLKADITSWPEESRRLGAITFAWLSSCADRRVRDLSAKAMARLLVIEPAIGELLAIEFRGLDDDYVLESITQAIYSACLLVKEKKQEFLSTLIELISPLFDTPNVLIRDAILLLAKVVDPHKSDADLQKSLERFPSKSSLPTKWPTMIDAKPLLETTGIPINMDLYSRGMNPDFWRYQVEPLLGHFDLESAGITKENIASWITVETFKLGYPGVDDCGLNADRAIVSEFGSGRGRAGYAERLGKKYYWILLHRLLGMLSDNITSKDRYSDWKAGPGHLWSVEVRKSDVTDMRDILPVKDYPDELLEWPKYQFPEQTSDMRSWVSADDLPQHQDAIIRKSKSGDEWVALLLDVRETDAKSNHDSFSQPYLSRDFHYTSMFVEGSIPNFGSNADRSPLESQGAHFSKAYLAEYPDNPLYDQYADQGYFYTGGEGFEFTDVTLMRGGEWEYEYSSILNDKAQKISVPCRDLIRVLGLVWDQQRGWTTAQGELVAFEATNRNLHGLFITRVSLNAYLTITKRKLIYRRFAMLGFITPNHTNNSQKDVFTWLLYVRDKKPKLLHHNEQRFNC
jgi:hypothetical protein